MRTVADFTISLVVPCFNEAENIDIFLARAVRVLSQVAPRRYEIICVNDGSRDDTLARLITASKDEPGLRILDLSRNFGKEAALTAGLDVASGDVVIPIDADLQHPPEVIPEMLARWQEGYEVVLARRRSRETDHVLQRRLANLFYRAHNRLSECEIPDNVGDFRLLERRVVEALRQLPERSRFMKGLFAWVGFRTTIVEFEVAPRNAGYSSFSGWRLWNLALEGITSFSTVPLRLWTYVGAVISVLAFIYGSWIVLRTLILGTDLPGYASLISAIVFIGGIQLIGIGVLGEYIGRIYNEVKQRPVYLVRERYGFPESRE